jgi:hypothetical protein
MTEDILFDNIYVGHSEEDAKKLAAETFDVKKPLEEAESKKSTKLDDDEEEPKSFKEDPVSFIRQKVLDFVDVAKVDPVFAFKSQPETGAAIVAAFTTFLGVILSLIGVIGSAQKPVTKVCALYVLDDIPRSDLSFLHQSSKKTDAPTPDDKKKTEAAPVAPAGGEKKEDTPVKKRKN